MQPKYFPEVAVKLLETAEASGEMDVMLDRVADDLERYLDLRNDLLTSMIYPAIVIAMSVAVTAFLVTKVLPKFATYLEKRSVALPSSTQFLMNFSEFVIRYGSFITVCLLILMVVMAVSYKTRRGRAGLDRLVLSLPIIGKLLIAGCMAHLSHTLSLLLRSGIPLLASLRILSGVLTNKAIAKRIDLAAEAVLRGGQLTSALRHSIIPPLIPQIVAVGECSGSLDQVFEEVGEFYQNDLKLRLKRLSAALEPVMILLLGIVVGFLYYSFFQAVISVVVGT